MTSAAFYTVRNRPHSRKITKNSLNTFVTRVIDFWLGSSGLVPLPLISAFASESPVLSPYDWSYRLCLMNHMCPKLWHDGTRIAYCLFGRIPQKNGFCSVGNDPAPHFSITQRVPAALDAQRSTPTTLSVYKVVSSDPRAGDSERRGAATSDRHYTVIRRCKILRTRHKILMRHIRFWLGLRPS